MLTEWSSVISHFTTYLFSVFKILVEEIESMNLYVTQNLEDFPTHPIPPSDLDFYD